MGSTILHSKRIDTHQHIHIHILHLYKYVTRLSIECSKTRILKFDDIVNIKQGGPDIKILLFHVNGRHLGKWLRFQPFCYILYAYNYSTDSRPANI